MASRTDHLQWCKTRALEYCEKGDTTNALTSMLSDLKKHPDTENHGGMMIGMKLMMDGLLSTQHEVKKFIEGFN